MINKDKWGKLADWMTKLQINEADLIEKFILGSGKGGQKFVEVFLIKEHFVPVVTVVIKTFLAFGDGYEIIVTTCRANVKKVGPSFSRLYALAV